MRRVLIVDQFCGITPYALHNEAMTFEALVAEATEPKNIGITKAQVTDVPDDFKPEWATTVVAADEDGRAFVWRSNWDTSG